MATHPNASLACTLVVIQGKGIFRSMPWHLFQKGQSDKLKLLPIMQCQLIQHSLPLDRTDLLCLPADIMDFPKSQSKPLVLAGAALYRFETAGTQV